MGKRLCIKCGVMQPLEDFKTKLNGQRLERSKVCNRHEVEVLTTKKERKKNRAKKRVKKLKMIDEHDDYMKARHRGPRRVTQMKASRLPFTTPEGMTANDYAIYLTSPHWEGFRSRYANENPWVCFVCKEIANQLHHISYVRLGMEKFEDVTPLCRKHHKDVHGAVRQGVPLNRAHLYTKNLYRDGRVGDEGNEAGSLKIKYASQVDTVSGTRL